VDTAALRADRELVTGAGEPLRLLSTAGRSRCRAVTGPEAPTLEAKFIKRTSGMLVPKPRVTWCCSREIVLETWKADRMVEGGRGQQVCSPGKLEELRAGQGNPAW